MENTIENCSFVNSCSPTVLSSMVVMAVAKRAALRQGMFSGKGRVVKLRHIIIQGTHGGYVLCESELCHQIADAAGVKIRRVLIECFAVLDRKFPRIRIGIPFTLLCLCLQLFPAFSGI
mgnify:CR=1 FL=1